MSGTHAVFAPSGSGRYMACPGSIALSKDIPPRPSSEDAASGTCTHFLAYRAQAHDVDPMCYVGDELTFDGFTFKIDEERAQRVAAYVLTGVQTARCALVPVIFTTRSPVKSDHLRCSSGHTSRATASGATTSAGK